ncbi:MAG TPA: RodZ domain-containing protein [Vicinamibacteria bacterium]|nr:RodZ domain-containing protein [Vicinamibacteria bacterium]
MASFGENLKRERELRGVSLRDMAEATKISLRFLDALEKGRVDQLPGGLFPRAFVRQYAKQLGLDAEKIVAEFLYEHGESGLPDKPHVPHAPHMPGSPAVSRGVLLFLAVAIAGGVLTWKRLGSARDAASAVPPSTSLPVVIQPTDRVYPPPPSLGARSTPVMVTGSGITLSLTAQADCWVLAEADGQTVLNRVLSSGESETFEARGQIVLSVGNAGGLVIKVNDHPGVSLGRRGEVKRNIVINKESLPSFVKETNASPAGS